MSKLWQKKYRLDPEVEAFTVGDDYIIDQQLVKFDCQASIAHARMLGKTGILQAEETDKLVRELNKIIDLESQGQFTLSPEQEDCHTAIENYLTDQLGDLGKKIHTGRSRNDQVLTALRLYYKEELTVCRLRGDQLIKSLSAFIKKYGAIAFPGYTHQRKAMPSSIELWGNAFIDSMRDNQKLLDAAFDLTDQSPLGSGAGYGVPLKMDREFTAQVLGFSRVQTNPIYVQNSRGKLESTLLHALSQVMLDLNKIATDLILFSMPEFGYFELPDEFCTGSSIMPQKKNPDILEILQGNYQVVLSNEFQIKTLGSNLISGYSRSMQLIKAPTMKSLTLTLKSLSVTASLFNHLKVNKEACERALTEEVFATEKVYELVQKGMSFREAYQQIAKKY